MSLCGAPDGQAGFTDEVATVTVESSDPRRAERIEAFRARWPERWTTLEVPRILDEVLPRRAEWEGGVVIDGVAFALINLMLALVGLAAFVARDDARIRAGTCRAAPSKRRRPRVIWVTNEVRSIVPHDKKV